MAKVVSGICNFRHARNHSSKGDKAMKINSSEKGQALIIITFAAIRGLDVDQPRNLAKSVTVE